MAKGSSKTLFVGGLSIYIGEQELYQYFQTYSKVLKVVFLRDCNSGKSKGYAFVTLKDADVAQEVASMKHVILGRQVECQLAVRKCEKVQNSHERMRKKLYVTNITPHLSDAAFKEYFEAFGQVHNCYIIKNPELNCNRNYGFVEFEDIEVTEYLLHLQTPLVIGGVRIYIHPFKDKDQVKHAPEAYTCNKTLKKERSRESTDTLPDSPASNEASSEGLHETEVAAKLKQVVPKSTVSNPQLHKFLQVASKKPLTFSQKHPIKGEVKPNELGSNYHLRVSNPGTFNSSTKHLPLFNQTEGRYHANPVQITKCGHCQRLNHFNFATTGSLLRAEPSSCSCKASPIREFSLFFKGSSSVRASVNRQ
jgi:RNA recognition motif-containing protein